MPLIWIVYTNSCRRLNRSWGSQYTAISLCYFFKPMKRRHMNMNFSLPSQIEYWGQVFNLPHDCKNSSRFCHNCKVSHDSTTLRITPWRKNKLQKLNASTTDQVIKGHKTGQEIHLPCYCLSKWNHNSAISVGHPSVGTWYVPYLFMRIYVL